MPYGLALLIGSMALGGVYVLVSEAPIWSKVLIAGLLVASFAFRYGFILQAAVAVFLLLYFTFMKSRAERFD